jgi:glycosyltransferase involved in cell wall biosynthesis
MTRDSEGLTVIAPCLNEEGNIPLLVERLHAALAPLPVPTELVLVDDGSRDATWARIRDAERAHGWVSGVRHERNRGIVAGWRSALAVSRQPLVCLIDSDLQNRPEDVPRLLAAWGAGTADVVQGVRHPNPGEVRTVFSRGLNAVLNTTFGMRLLDNKSGFLLTRTETLRALLEDAEGYRYFQSLVGVAAGLRGLSIEEVDTRFDRRHAGTSFLARYPVLVSARVLAEVARYRVETVRRPPARLR